MGENCMDCKNVVDSKVAGIRDYCNSAGVSKVVIGISGGKDSLVAAKLCVSALGADNVYGILMPNGKQPDIMRAYASIISLGIGYEEINIKNIFNSFTSALGINREVKNTETLINLAPRLRMAVLYAKASELGALVCGTGNKCEMSIGYFTKFGDGACDFNPLGDLLKSEVVELGLYLDLPPELVNAAPADGLSGKTDEEKLGFSYEELENCLSGRYNLNNAEINAKILGMVKRSTHKRIMPPIINY